MRANTNDAEPCPFLVSRRSGLDGNGRSDSHTVPMMAIYLPLKAREHVPWLLAYIATGVYIIEIILAFRERVLVILDVFPAQSGRFEREFLLLIRLYVAGISGLRSILKLSTNASFFWIV